MGASAEIVSLVYTAAASGYPHQVCSIHQAGSTGMRAGKRMGSRTALAISRRGAEGDFKAHSRRNGKPAQVAWNKDQRTAQGGEVRRVGIVDSHTGGEPT